MPASATSFALAGATFNLPTIHEVVHGPDFGKVLEFGEMSDAALAEYLADLDDAESFVVKEIAWARKSAAAEQARRAGAAA